MELHLRRGDLEHAGADTLDVAVECPQAVDELVDQARLAQLEVRDGCTPSLPENPTTAGLPCHYPNGGRSYTTGGGGPTPSSDAPGARSCPNRHAAANEPRMWRAHGRQETARLEGSPSGFPTRKANARTHHGPDDHDAVRRRLLGRRNPRFHSGHHDPLRRH